MFRKINDIEIKSAYNRDENFTLDNIPKHFDSVKNESLSKLRRSAMRKVEIDTDLKPGALQMALKSVDGQFEDAYSTLEGDYSSRKDKLRDVYIQSVSDLNRDLKKFNLQVEECNIAFRKYSDANRIINGEPLSNRLAYDVEELSKMKQAIEEL